VAIDVPVYVDSSALAKLVVQEPESHALSAHLRTRRLATSELALVEIARAEKLAQPAQTTGATAQGVLDEADLVLLRRSVLARAAELTSHGVRSLDAIHLASALEIQPDHFVAYDRRLLEAAAAAGLTTVSPR
jgi:predicted nucleic acid-binding protein